MAGDESSVRVAVRIRPQTAAEVVEGCGVCARAGGAAGEGGVVLGADRAFTFDFAFEPASSQQQVYETCVRKLVEAALDGYNATVLAYGQTGSGKTYTMGSGWEGDDADEALRGVIPRAIRDLFAGAHARAEAARARGQLPPEFSVQAQFIELYNEDIVDLLDPAKDPYAKTALRITEDGCGGVRVAGASMRAVRGAAEALAALRAGALARTTAATNMNSSSSRSHAVFTLLMRQRRLADQEAERDGEAEAEAEAETDPAEQYETLTAKFHFVDLAGSERLKRTGATGERAKEGISINCGLLALGNVISALGDRSRRALHVPYRDSKLTRLLQDSLGGNSNTVMIACVSPSDRDFMETLNTLKYANRARNIKNRCVVNQDLTSRTINQLRHTVARLQQELDEFKQGKRVISDSGEEGWSDVAQENAILAAEAEALRRRVKAMQLTIDQLLARNAQLQAEKALSQWAPANQTPEAADCSLTQLVQGYVNEIEELRAQLMEANAMQQTRRRPRHDSLAGPALLDGAKRELYKEKELLARSMGELEFQRKLNMSDSLTASDGRPIGERAEAEGESDSDSPASDSDADAEPAEDGVLSAQLAALSEDIDTKARLIEQLEASERRLAALRAHYEARLDTLHTQIKAAAQERDRVLADLQSQTAPPAADKLKRVRDEYERKVSGMARELRRLQAAQREHTRLQRAQAQATQQLTLMRAQLHDMKRDKVKLVQRMRAEAKRHAQAEAVRAKEVAQLRKESRKNANIIRSLEAETKLKEQVLKRKQEEVSLLRRSNRDKLSGMAGGRARDSGADDERSGLSAWKALEAWLTRREAARAALGRLEAQLTAQLAAREAARAQPAPVHSLHSVQRAIAGTQQQIMQLEEADEAEEAVGAALIAGVRSVGAARYVLQRLCARAPPPPAPAPLPAPLPVADNPPDECKWSAVAAAFAHVSSGTSTRSVSPVDSRDALELPSPDDPPSPFHRNLERRGSVRLRDLGVVPLADMTQSLREAPASPRPAPLSRVPSAPGGLRGLLPVSSPLPARRTLPPADTKGPHHSLDSGRTPPASPGAVRRARDHDVFLRLTGASADHSPPAPGQVKEVAGKRVSGGGGGSVAESGAWLQCTHVAEGHAGAALALHAGRRLLYSGGADGTVRGWDMRAGAEAWRGAAGGAAGALAAHRDLPAVVLAAAGAAVRLFDDRSPAPQATLWSSGVTGPHGVAGGETAVTALALAAAHRLYAAAGDRLRLWDLRRMECVCKAWSGHAAPVMCLCVAGERAGGGEVVVSGSKDHYVRTLQLTESQGVWECGSRRLLEPPHYDGVQALAVAGAGAGADVLYSASRDSAIKRWELPAGNRPAQLTHSVMNAHKGWVTGVALVSTPGAGAGPGAEGDSLVASCGRDGALRAWAWGGAALRPAARARLPAPALALAAQPDRPAVLYTATSGGDVRAWRLHVDTQ